VVAIVGGGASGTLLAAQLARRGVSSAIIDGSGRAGKGIAYSTLEDVHLLNVRAESMSAWPDKPDDFAKRFEAHDGNPSGYAPRKLYGRYLGHILDEAVAGGLAEIIKASVVGARRKGSGWRLELGDGSAVESEALALATGNQEPAEVAEFSDAGRRLIGNPWGSEARAAVERLAQEGGDVLVVGTGLTMVDLVLSLDAAGHQGRIVAVSRRGLIPRSHAEFTPAPVDSDQLPHGDLRALARWLRRRSAEVGWRAAVDSLRPHTQQLWQELGTEQQRRFLRHARAWWDVHRSRIAPEVAATFARLVAEGRLEVIAGRIVSAREADGGLEVEYRRRGVQTAQTGRFAYAFNCTGPLHAISRSKDPLLRNLLDSTDIRPDPLGIGVDVAEKSRAGERLWALGPLTRGRYWEIIAVPDIREQAAAVADDIERELKA
jgi:uncharacterized NAD(P)/FAD-binding protein YdhS